VPTPSELAPQLVALVAVVSFPVVFAYLGLKGALQFWLARREGLGTEFLRKKRRWLIPVFSVNLCLGLLYAYGWLWEAHWVERVDVEIDASIPAPLRFVHLSDLHLEGFGKRESRAIELVNSADPDIVFSREITSRRPPGISTRKSSGGSSRASMRTWVSLPLRETGITTLRSGSMAPG
jgi:hypothetical protein